VSQSVSAHVNARTLSCMLSMQTCIPRCVLATRRLLLATWWLLLATRWLLLATRWPLLATPWATLRCRWRMASGNAHVNIRWPKSRACCPRMLSTCMADRNERWRTYVYPCVLEPVGLLLRSSTRVLWYARLPPFFQLHYPQHSVLLSGLALRAVCMPSQRAALCDRADVVCVHVPSYSEVAHICSSVRAALCNRADARIPQVLAFARGAPRMENRSDRGDCASVV
jgi:hypothetical protein